MDAVRRENDRYGKARASLYALLDTPASGRVLSVGTTPDIWRRPSTRTDAVVHLGQLWQPEQSYDLILYHCGSAPDARTLAEDLRNLKKMTTQGGHLVLFGEPSRHTPSVRNLVRGCLPKRRMLPCSREQVRLAMQAAGLEADKVFVTETGLEHSDEYFCPSEDGTDVTDAGYAICVSVQQIEDSPLFRAVERQVSHQLSPDGTGLQLERFALRQRGALVLFSSARTGGRAYISRLVADDETDRIVRCNHLFLRYLHGSAPLAPDDLQLLPLPVGQACFRGCTIFTETRMQGVLAWKVCKNGVGQRLYRDATGFIQRLHNALCRPVHFHASRLHDLFDADLRRIGAYGDGLSAPGKRVEALGGRIRHRLLDRHGFLTASHGDYGYGNILVQPQTGRLTGVIDWDTGRREEFPGVDLLNLEIQKLRIEQGCGFYPAFRQSCRELLQQRGLNDDGRYAEMFGLRGDMLATVAAVCLLRYMGRAARYPEVFLAEQRDYRRALNFFSKEVLL